MRVLFQIRFLEKGSMHKCVCVCVCAQLLSHVRLLRPHGCSPPGSFVHRIHQSRILEQVAISSSRGSSWPSDQTCVSCVSYIAGGFFTLWAIGKALYSYNLSLLISCLKMATFTSGYATHKSAHIFISELSVTLGTSLFWIKKISFLFPIIQQSKCDNIPLPPNKESLKWWRKYSCINMHL